MQCNYCPFSVTFIALLMDRCIWNFTLSLLFCVCVKMSETSDGNITSFGINIPNNAGNGTRHPSQQRKDILKSLFNGYDAWISPNYDQNFPVENIVQLYILSIDSIQDTSMDYTMSFYLRQRWHDSRLKYNATSDIDVLELDTKIMNNVWIPDVYFINEKQASFHEVTVPNKMMYIYPDGLVLFSTRVTGVFSCMMELKKYPLDRQICHIKMESYSHSAKTILIRWRDVPVVFSPTLRLPQFSIEKNKPFICDTLYMGINYSCIGIDIYLSRNRGYYITQIYVPSFLLVVLSWVNFWLNVDSVPARISLGLLTVLAMTTQSTSFISNLQKVSYIKALDVWLAVCSFFVFAALLEFAYVNVSYRVENRRKSVVDLPIYLHSNGHTNGAFNGSEEVANPSKKKEKGILSSLVSKRREKARNIDRVSRFVFPLSFVIFNAIYWSVYLLWEPVKDEHGE